MFNTQEAESPTGGFGSEPFKPQIVKARRAPSAKLSRQQKRAKHRRLMSYYNQELARQSANREQQRLDFDYYDNEQWSEEDRQIYEDRGQKPLTYNVIATTIDWITGTEKRARTDFKVLPRQKEGSKAAEIKTQTLKFLSDVNGTSFAVSRAFEEAVKGGVGWVEDAWSEDGYDEPIYSRFESWRNMLWDSMAVENDLSDARYITRTKFVDLDIAEAWFPDQREALRRSAYGSSEDGSYPDNYGDPAMDAIENEADGSPTLMSTGEEAEYERPRVRMIEIWYREPKMIEKIRGGQFNGERYDETSRGHYNDLAMANASGTRKVAVVTKMDFEVRCAIMTPDDMIYDAKSPYRHGRFPFTPVWGYRRNRNGMPYGVIRRIRDIQDDVNIRAAKALHILATNKTIMDEGAVDDLDEYLEEISQSDAVIVKQQGKELIINADRDLAAPHMELMARSIQMIQSVGGVTDENMGRQTNARSGRAVVARQEQGALTTAGLFDNLLFARKLQGEKQSSLVEQFFTDEKTFRITNSRGKPIYIAINEPDPVTGMPMFENDITATKADFIITEDEWRASVRQSKVDQMMEMIQNLGPVAPQIVLTTIDLLVESMDLPNGEEIVTRIRQVTGMSDPDSEEKTPEETARDDDRAAEKDRMIRMQEAEIAEKEASAAQKRAAAGSSDATAKSLIASMPGKSVEAQQKALETALAMLQVPQAVSVADGVLRESGFVSRSEEEENANIDQQAAGLEELAAEGAAMQQQAEMEQQGAEAPPQDGGGACDAAPVAPAQPNVDAAPPASTIPV